MAAPSSALRELQQALQALPTDQPVTVGVLMEKLDEAARSAEFTEYSEYMGEDM